MAADKPGSDSKGSRVSVNEQIALLTRGLPPSSVCVCRGFVLCVWGGESDAISEDL